MPLCAQVCKPVKRLTYMHSRHGLRNWERTYKSNEFSRSSEREGTTECKHLEFPEILRKILNVHICLNMNSFPLTQRCLFLSVSSYVLLKYWTYFVTQPFLPECRFHRLRMNKQSLWAWDPLGRNVRRLYLYTSP